MNILKKQKEAIMRVVFTATATVSIICVALICLFLFVSGVPTMGEIGFFEFFTGTDWRPLQGVFGILPMIVGSIYVTAGAIVFGVPVGILTAVYMAKFCPKSVYRILKPLVNLLAGIPSIVYGFFGLVVIVPFIRDNFGGFGSSILAASVLLGIMILPTIITVTESALKAVPDSYYEGALALGATKERSIFKVVLPSAKSGVFASVILGIGRAIGETMAVNLVAGNQPRVPGSVLDGARTLTANIVMEMGYATGMHREALIATAVVLFVFILIINLSFNALKRRMDK